ncbi:MAG: hypothetical protein K2G93_00895 [Rikenella sp.]|nr:hypothetical protein [Rikenella sp.]
MCAVGGNGHSWASSFTGIYAYNLYFNYDGMNRNINNPRGYGLQLRCLQE